MLGRLFQEVPEPSHDRRARDRIDPQTKRGRSVLHVEKHGPFMEPGDDALTGWFVRIRHHHGKLILGYAHHEVIGTQTRPEKVDRCAIQRGGICFSSVIGVRLSTWQINREILSTPAAGSAGSHLSRVKV